MSDDEARPPNPVHSARAPRGAVTVNISRHLNQRKATAAHLDRLRRVFVTQKEFGPRGMKARVLMDRRYYDVNERQLNRLRSGTSPDDLSLEEVDPE